ncbi:reverse transcriptase domain-containing protein [Tanacetum coccineum]
MDAMTIKMDAQYKELQSRAKKTTSDLDEDDMPMSHEEEAKFMQTFHKNRFYNDYRDRDSNRDNCRSSGRNDYNRDNYRSNTDDKPYDLPKQFNDFMKSKKSTNIFVIRVKEKQLNLGVGTERMIFNIDSSIKHSYSNDDTCFSIDVIDEILEEDLDALLDEGSKILHSIEGTLLEEEIFSEFDKFIEMTADENSKSEIDTEEPPFKKITINTDYKIKTSLEEPPTDLELKPLPDNLEYIQLLDDKKLVVQKQRRLNPNIQEVVKKIIVKLLDTGIIYPIADSPWVSRIHSVPKKGSITVVTNKNNELVPTRTVTGWRVCIDYHKLNEATAKDQFPLPFMDQMLERLIGNKYFYFLDGFSRYFQIPIDPNDQEKTTFTCPFGTYAYRRMPFGLCNAPATFQRCMLAIFYDMIEKSVEVFMDNFSVFENSFDKCLNNLDKMLQRCKDAHFVLNWEKCHFMVKEGIVLGHKVSSA